MYPTLARWHEQAEAKKRPDGHGVHRVMLKVKTAATCSPALHCSTIGAIGLNFSVRNGKRWNPDAVTTGMYHLPHPGLAVEGRALQESGTTTTRRGAVSKATSGKGTTTSKDRHAPQGAARTDARDFKTQEHMRKLSGY